jgi:uncharacterized protein YidB (DUF937 family)
MFARLRDRRVALAAATVLGGAALFGGYSLASTTFPYQAEPSALQTDERTTDAKDRPGIAAVLQKLVDQGVITAEQRDKILAALKESRPAKAPGLERFVKMTLEEAAKAIGITLEQLKTELPGKSLAQVAQAHGVSRDTLVQRLVAAGTARLDQAATEKKLTADQVTKLKERLPQAIGRFVDAVREQRAPSAHKFAIETLKEAAAAIGITPEQLRSELPGKSLAQVAQAHGVSRDALVQKLVAAVTARIDTAVAEKKLTAEQAAKLKEGLSGRIGTAVDRVRNERPKQ